MLVSEAMTKKEIVEFASANGIEIDPKLSKKELIDQINGPQKPENETDQAPAKKPVSKQTIQDHKKFHKFKK